MLCQNVETMATAKQDVGLLLSRLPDNSSLEDIQYHLYVLDKVRKGLSDGEKHKLPQSEVEQRLSRWLSE